MQCLHCVIKDCVITVTTSGDKVTWLFFLRIRLLTTRFVNEKYVNEPSNNINHIYALNDRVNRHWFPEDIPRRAYHSAKEEQFRKYTESDLDMWKWELRYDEYVPLQINQRALSFWIDKARTPSNRRHCTPCEGINPLNHMNCTAYPHYLYEGGTRTDHYSYTWWPQHQL
ncbi:hypothetical protein DAPPUDRAFT_261683 [Daphnia pulex]|uniref:Uncharacterized protein n=1 Tax=Daphnia pulex TaxID=6669 RepID=E9HLG1_DAPPU|nr:hypothetical protein DAPPUDRAFT_261683 [Daphnia pulex]|eukprot:EFX67435.1 hypothetical protein DAPPUDRAFT_261683 [Daphnia pulex]